MKLHLTEDGPRQCKAGKRECPIGGNHFTSEAAAWHAYNKNLEQSYPALDRIAKRKTLEKVIQKTDADFSVYNVAHKDVGDFRLRLRAKITAYQAKRFSNLVKKFEPEGADPKRNELQLHLGEGKDVAKYKGITSSTRGILGIVRREAVYIQSEFVRRGEGVPEALIDVTEEADAEKKEIDWTHEQVRLRLEGDHN